MPENKTNPHTALAAIAAEIRAMPKATECADLADKLDRIAADLPPAANVIQAARNVLAAVETNHATGKVPAMYTVPWLEVVALKEALAHPAKAGGDVGEDNSGIDWDVVRRSYGFIIADTGELHGLTAGDHHYEATGLFVDMAGWSAEPAALAPSAVVPVEAKTFTSYADGMICEMEEVPEQTAAPASGGDAVAEIVVGPYGVDLVWLSGESKRSFRDKPYGRYQLATLATRDGVWVPREPTEAMREAGFLADASDDRRWAAADVDAIYAAMLAAAPKGDKEKI